MISLLQSASDIFSLKSTTTVVKMLFKHAGTALQKSNNHELKPLLFSCNYKIMNPLSHQNELHYLEIMRYQTPEPENHFKHGCSPCLCVINEEVFKQPRKISHQSEMSFEAKSILPLTMRSTSSYLFWPTSPQSILPLPAPVAGSPRSMEQRHMLRTPYA